MKYGWNKTPFTAALATTTPFLAPQLCSSSLSGMIRPPSRPNHPSIQQLQHKAPKAQWVLYFWACYDVSSQNVYCHFSHISPVSPATSSIIISLSYLSYWCDLKRKHQNMEPRRYILPVLPQSVKQDPFVPLHIFPRTFLPNSLDDPTEGWNT